MFFRRKRFFRFVLLAVLVVGMFGLFSSVAYQAGWSQGFVSGQIVDGTAVGNAAPFNQGVGFPGHFSIFRLALTAFFMLMFFLFMAGLSRRLLFGGRRRHLGGRWNRGRWAGGHNKHGRHGGHGRHGQHRHHRAFAHHKHDHDGRGRHKKRDSFKGQRPPWYDDTNGEPVMKA